MKSQKGLALINFVLLIIVLMLILGAATYVALSGEGTVQSTETNIVNEVE